MITVSAYLLCFVTLLSRENILLHQCNCVAINDNIAQSITQTLKSIFLFIACLAFAYDTHSMITLFIFHNDVENVVTDKIYL